MKSTILTILFIAIITGISSGFIYAQNNEDQNGKTIFLVTKNDGTEFLGEILSQDAREILMKTEKIGDVYIPKHEIKSIKEVNPKFYEDFSGEEIFSTRYFITTNGLPIKKGDNYILWNIYGPDFQFGIADNFGVGIMTSWAAIPIIANAKYSIKLGEKSNMALGVLLGTGSWAFPDFGLALPFTSFTYGNRKNNLTFSVGYAGLAYSTENYNPITNEMYDEKFKEGRVLFSLAGMFKINSKFSIVFDTFISPWGPELNKTEWISTDKFDPSTNQYLNTTWTQRNYTEKSPGLAIILPGIRWHLDSNKAFQFGFTGFYYDNEFVPFPIPMVQWFRKL